VKYELSADEWYTIEDLVAILEPIAFVSTLFQGQEESDAFCTISCVIPLWRNLINQLEGTMFKRPLSNPPEALKVADMSSEDMCARDMIAKDLKRRWDAMLRGNSQTRDTIVKATALDMRYFTSLTLQEQQLAEELLRREYSELAKVLDAKRKDKKQEEDSVIVNGNV
jgi:hypothetical protein